MRDSYQNEIPKARINIKLDLHTGNAQKKMELPLKLLVTGDFSNGQEQPVLSERQKVNVNKNNFDSVLAEFSPALNISVEKHNHCKQGETESRVAAYPMLTGLALLASANRLPHVLV